MAQFESISTVFNHSSQPKPRTPSAKKIHKKKAEQSIWQNQKESEEMDFETWWHNFQSQDEIIASLLRNRVCTSDRIILCSRPGWLVMPISKLGPRDLNED
jgi:hypothetical protein